MLIGLDARSLARPEVRGMGRYVWHLMDAMRRAAPEVRWRLYYDADRPAPALPPGTPASLTPMRCRGDRWRLWEQLALPLRAAGVDVLHAPGTFAPALQLSPTVVTVHDTLLWDEPQPSGSGRFYLYDVLPRALRRARRIVTISRHSWADIARRFPFTRRKMDVIYHGLDPRFLEPPAPEAVAAMRSAAGLDGPYVLYVGGSLPRKRAVWAVELLERWARAPRGRTLCLAMLGLAGQPTDEVLHAARRLGVAHRVRLLPYVDDARLPALYAGSEFVLYPTLYEGFGFPALEAQAAGRVVLTSRASSLLELAGPAARLLEPGDFEAWLRAGEVLLAHPDERDAPASAAREWARRFTWERAARQTAEVYRQAA